MNLTYLSEICEIEWFVQEISEPKPGHAVEKFWIINELDWKEQLKDTECL